MKPIKLFYSILDEQGKKNLIFNIFLSTIVMFSEIFTATLIFPMIAMILNKDLNLNFIDISFLLSFFPENHVLLYFLGFFLSFFLIKSLFFLYVLWCNLNFTFLIKQKLNKKLFINFINVNFEFYLKYKKAKIVNNVTNEINFISNSAKHILVIITESLVIFGIIIFFLLVDYQITLIFLLMISLLSFFIYFYKKKIFFYGKIRSSNDEKVIFFLSEAVNGFRELKIYQKFKYFVTKFDESIKNSTKSFIKSSFLTGMPRQIIDVIFILLLTLNIFLLNFFSDSYETDLFKLLGFYAIIGFRIIPSINRIVTSLGGISMVQFPIINYINIINELKNNIDSDLKIRANTKFDKIISRNLNFKFNAENNYLFQNLNFEIEKNQKIGITGPSGTGKTTLLNILMGLLNPTSGEIYFINDGIKNNPGNIKFSYVPQDSFLFDASIKQNITLEIDNHKVDDNLLAKSIDSAQMKNYISSLVNGVDTKIGYDGTNLSGGEKQRIAIARALYTDANILILDEITSSLDSANANKILNIINDINNKTIIMISHIKEHLEICDKIINLEENK
jgi:ABC-type multidrug transport system fused ATPase/permease subunit